MKQVRIFLMLSLCVVLSGCLSIPGLATRMYVNDKLERVQLGNTPQQVIYLMGEPDYVTSFQAGSMLEVWEFRAGNFLYSETAYLVLRDQRVIARPQHVQELVQIFQAHGVAAPAQFWDKSRK